MDSLFETTVFQATDQSLKPLRSFRQLQRSIRVQQVNARPKAFPSQERWLAEGQKDEVVIPIAKGMIFMKLTEVLNEYFRQSTLKTLTMLKFCLLSLGMIIGILLPDSTRSWVIPVCGVVFIATYIPLMAKLFRIWKGNHR